MDKLPKYILSAYKALFKNVCIQRIIAMHIMFLGVILSTYAIWGWLTLEDLRLLCLDRGIEYESALLHLFPEEKLSFRINDPDDPQSCLFNYKVDPNELSRYIIPFSTMGIKTSPDNNEEKVIITGFNFFSGGILEPFIIMTVNTRNAVFVIAIGYLTGVYLVLLGFYKEGMSVNPKFVLWRPMLGGISALLLFIVILSGGSLIWEQVASPKSFSLGMLSVIASLGAEKLPSVLGISKDFY